MNMIVAVIALLIFAAALLSSSVGHARPRFHGGDGVLRRGAHGDEPGGTDVERLGRDDRGVQVCSGGLVLLAVVLILAGLMLMLA